LKNLIVTSYSFLKKLFIYLFSTKEGALLGELTSAALKYVFSRLRDGDRYAHNERITIVNLFELYYNYIIRSLYIVIKAISRLELTSAALKYVFSRLRDGVRYAHNEIITLYIVYIYRYKSYITTCIQ
jgi:hypothetical protein